MQMRKHSSATLYALLLRDGTMYYFVLTVLEATNLIMFAHADVSDTEDLHEHHGKERMLIAVAITFTALQIIHATLLDAWSGLNTHLSDGS